MTLSLTKRIAGGAVGLTIGTLLALAAPLTYAQTDPYADPASSSPGVPNTGAGGDPATAMALLGTSAAAIIAGGAYLALNRRRA